MKPSVVLPLCSEQDVKRLTYISVSDNKIVSRGQSIDRQANACTNKLPIIEESKLETRFSRRRQTHVSSVATPSLSSVSNYKEKDSGIIDFNADLRLTDYAGSVNEIPLYSSMMPAHSELLNYPSKRTVSSRDRKESNLTDSIPLDEDGVVRHYVSIKNPLDNRCSSNLLGPQTFNISFKNLDQD